MNRIRAALLPHPLVVQKLGDFISNMFLPYDSRKLIWEKDQGLGFAQDEQAIRRDQVYTCSN